MICIDKICHATIPNVDACIKVIRQGQIDIHGVFIYPTSANPKLIHFIDLIDANIQPGACLNVLELVKITPSQIVALLRKHDDIIQGELAVGHNLHRAVCAIVLFECFPGAVELLAILDFDINEVVGGKYVLKEYWTPRDGSYYVRDVRDKFPDEVEDEALDTQKYILAQKQTCYDQGVRYGGVDTYSAVEHLFEVIESSPATSSRPADYIDAHSVEYRELMYYGDYTLQYIFSKFHLEGNQTGLRGQLMRIALDDLAPEAQLRLHAETGQAYFDEWKAGALQISEQHDMEWIKENQPAIYLLLRMINE